MALLSISEPGQSPRRKVEKKHALGIDLGTTNSLAAVASPDGAKVIEEVGKTLLPSVVAYLKEAGAERVL